MAEKSQERWGHRLQEKGFSPREGGGRLMKEKRGVKARLGVGRGSWARLLLGSTALTEGLRGGPLEFWKGLGCTGQDARTCVDTVECVSI